MSKIWAFLLTGALVTGYIAETTSNAVEVKVDGSPTAPTSVSVQSITWKRYVDCMDGVLNLDDTNKLTSRVPDCRLETIRQVAKSTPEMERITKMIQKKQ